MKFIIHTDGASRGNPGPAAAGIVIQSEDGVIWVQDGKYLGIATNNVAEYSAVRLALRRLISDFAKYLPTEVTFIVDSQLVAQQLAGVYKVKNETLKGFVVEIQGLVKEVGRVKYQYTPRSGNSLADKLANMVLDKLETDGK